ncbi:MAG: class I SAM-dependent methyltransferase [Syntrophobacterales bacterium]|nr:class I SAM-dependent methyltransferase [Syntrophobacterales bacterium]
MAWIQRTEPYIYRVLDRHDWTGKRVLEVGCGQGSTLNYLPGLGANVCGVDMSKESLIKARRGADEMGHADRIELCTGDAELLPFSGESFDTVISIGVLHHTADTQGSICDILRVLKPGGVAIVMLYRSGNPKWWTTRSLRWLSFLLDRVKGEKFVIARRLRRRQKEGMLQGTALLELFGVPILKAFSNEECRAMFMGFSDVTITNHQPGFERNCDIIPVLRPFRHLFRRVDAMMEDQWGFYQVIEAYK